MATLKDVAKACGLSPMAVSFALNNKPGTVSKHTRERVLIMAAEIGYRPNAIARALQRGSTDTIGIYNGLGFLNTRLPVFAEILSGLEEGCISAELDLLMYGKMSRVSSADAYSELVNGKVDGMLLMTPPEDWLVERLVAERFPSVSILDRIPTLPSVVVDETAAAALSVEHLVQKGHRAVLYRTPPDPTENMVARITAFADAARTAGLKIITSAAPDWNGTLSDEEWRYLEHSDGRFTAVVGSTDLLAYPVCNACDELGLRIPEDMAVLGFNGIDPWMMPKRRLTTIRTEWRDLGIKGIAILGDIIQGESVAGETRIPVELVIGDTT